MWVEKGYRSFQDGGVAEQAFNVKGPLTILLIEDNPLDAELFTEFLADADVMDFEVIHVQRLSQALERLEDRDIDIVFLDFILPDSDGFQSLEKLRKYAPEVPVIMLTGLDDDEVGLKAVSAGAQDYLVKGQIGERTIWRILRYAIVRKRIEQQLRDQKMLEARVQQAQRAESLAALAGGIAHEYNNLLTGILGNATLALNDLPGDSKARRLLEDIRVAAKRAGTLTSQMLAYSGRGQFARDEMDLAGFVTEMVPLLEPSVQARGRFVVQNASRPLMVKADAHELRQVLVSLVSNAAESLAGPEGVVRLAAAAVRLKSSTTFEQGSITTKLPPGYYATMTVADTGSGIAEKNLPRIFDPFFTTKFTGRGLGLASVLGIVRGHEGAVKVTSEEGMGTTVQVFLPMCALPARPAKARKPRGQANSWRTNGVALVIDEEALIVSVTRKILEKHGMDVFSAPNWRVGVDLAREHGEKVCLTVLDSERLPADGSQALEAYRKAAPNTRFLLCSGFTELEQAKTFGTSKEVVFLQKPFPPEALLEKVRQLLE